MEITDNIDIIEQIGNWNSYLDVRIEHDGCVISCLELEFIFNKEILN